MLFSRLNDQRVPRFLDRFLIWLCANSKMLTSCWEIYSMACGRKKFYGGATRSCSTFTSLPKPEVVRISRKWTQFYGGSSRFTARNRHTHSSISCSADTCSARSSASHVISLTRFWNRSWTSVYLFRKKSHLLPAVTSEGGPKPVDLVSRHHPLHLSSSQNTKGRKNGLAKEKVI